MSISSTGLYGSATIVNTDLFNDVEALKEQVTTLSTSYLATTQEHRTDISQNRQDISSNLSKINDISGNKIPALESDISDNLSKINDILRASAQRTAARAATVAELRNQAIHDRVLAATTDIAPVIMIIDTYTLWWVSQWVELRKTRIAENGDPAVEVATHVRSYKEWVRATGARALVGMGGGTVPQTPE